MIINKTEQQLISLEDSAAMIRSGYTIWVGSGLSIPSLFLDRLADRYAELQNVTILGENFLNYSKLLADPTCRDAFHIISFYESIPFCFLPFETNKIEYIEKPGGPWQKTIYDSFNINVTVIEVCPPDGGSDCKLGITGEETTPYFSKCKGKKIAIINKFQQPARNVGEQNSIQLSDFDYICLCNHQLLKIKAS